mmetsp:Transcript_7345/g.11180  ORF Transcript_7345/g.11180 Transcript_7345/m.11180 type:complete len:423 (-) Transcript_7345:41-1309(-)
MVSSDIFCLADDLLDSIIAVEKSCGLENGFQETKTRTKKKEEEIDLSSSCFASSSTKNKPTATVIISTNIQDNEGSKSGAVFYRADSRRKPINSLTSSTSSTFTTKQGSGLQSTTSAERRKGNDQLMIAARKRLMHEKTKSKQRKALRENMEIKSKSSYSNVDTSKEDKSNASPNTSTPGEKDRNNFNHSPKLPAVKGSFCSKLEEKEIETIAYKCLDMFTKEVREFNEKCHGSAEKKQHMTGFASFLEEKYITLSLNLLPNENVIVCKVKKLINSFLDKCKDSPNDAVGTIDKITNLIGGEKRKSADTSTCLGRKRNTWQCVLCGMKEQDLKRNKCVVCGRSRGYRPKEYDVHRVCPIKEERAFIEGSAYFQKVKESNETTIDERKERQYLYNKKDFEIDSRMKLKSDVSDLLDSIRDFTT